MQILIIDDEAQVRHMLRGVLENEGYRVVEAANGREGLRMQHRTPSNLVITDILMPEMEGLETIRELRHQWPDVKVLAVSGASQKLGLDLLYVAKEFGATHMLQKPFSMSEMLKLISTMLNPSSNPPSGGANHPDKPGAP